MLWFMLATCSALLSAGSAILQKKILFRLNALEFSFILSLTVVILTVWIPFQTNVVSIPISSLMIIIGKSILGAGAFILVMLSLQHNQISSALPLLGLTPAAAAILSYVILGEELHHTEWIGIGLMMVGAYVLETKPHHTVPDQAKTEHQSQKYYFIYGAVILFAVSSVYDRNLVGTLNVDPLAVLFYQHIVYTVLFFSAIMLRGAGIRSVLQLNSHLFALIVIVALLTMAYRYTQLEATMLAPVALVLAVKRTSSLYATFFGGKFFSESRIGVKLVGAMLIVAAGFLILRNAG